MKSAETVLCALAEAMAADQRVLLVGDSFELLLTLAAQPVKELAVVSEQADPDAPSGLTAQGAPLRMRRDWKDRPNSKDLVLDPAGQAPLEELTRILKKQGLYLTLTENAITQNLPYKMALQTYAGLACANRQEEENLKKIGILEGKGPIIWLASKSPIPELPSFGCITSDCELSLSTETTDALLAQLEAQKARCTALQSERDHLENAFQNEVQKSQKLAETIESERKELAQARKFVEETEAQMADYDSIRQELAERRVDDKRYERLTERSEQTKQALTHELETLRAELQTSAAPAEEIHQLERDRQSLLNTGRHVLAVFHDVISQLAAWPKESTPPAFTENAALESWLQNTQKAVENASFALQKSIKNQAVAVQKAEDATRQMREMKAALQVLTAEAKEHKEPKAALPPESSEAQAAQIRALHSALDAERQLRQVETERHQALESEARSAIAERAARQESLHQARREAACARLEQAALKDEIRRLRLELATRDSHINDLNDLLEGHARMLALMTNSLQEAADAREEAEMGRRLADENLRFLRQEFERRQTAKES